MAMSLYASTFGRDLTAGKAIRGIAAFKATCKAQSQWRGACQEAEGAWDAIVKLRCPVRMSADIVLHLLLGKNWWHTTIFSA